MRINIRAHEFGPSKPRLRVWTEDSRIKVVNFDDVAEMKRATDKIGIGLEFVVHRCDGIEECQCKPLTALEEIPQY